MTRAISYQQFLKDMQGESLAELRKMRGAADAQMRAAQRNKDWLAMVIAHRVKAEAAAAAAPN